MKASFRRSRQLSKLVKGLDLVSLERNNKKEITYKINQMVMVNPDLMLYSREKSPLNLPFSMWEINEEINPISATEIPLAIKLNFHKGYEKIFGPRLNVGFFKEGFYLADSNIDPLGRYFKFADETLFLPKNYFPNGF